MSLVCISFALNRVLPPSLYVKYESTVKFETVNMLQRTVRLEWSLLKIVVELHTPIMLALQQNLFSSGLSLPTADSEEYNPAITEKKGH